MYASTQSYEKIQQLSELVTRAQAGDSQAFGELFEQYQPLVLSILVRRVGNYGDAQELTQDVFVKALTKLDQLRVPEAFVGWLKSIAVRMSINFIQRKKLVAGGDSYVDGVAAEDSGPEDVALASERRAEVHRCLGRLRDLDRETLEAFYVRGKSILEMSDEFSAPVGTIKRRLHVARHRLEAAIGEFAE
ncbi:MAG: sigma-70 family RNA polymerase sigma factor [Pirellulaceae bacterium]|nr:sigma-70 family RNA polymerase sigma factor [Pirellulaceae bacterium]